MRLGVDRELVPGAKLELPVLGERLRFRFFSGDDGERVGGGDRRGHLALVMLSQLHRR